MNGVIGVLGGYRSGDFGIVAEEVQVATKVVQLQLELLLGGVFVTAVGFHSLKEVQSLFDPVLKEQIVDGSQQVRPEERRLVAEVLQELFILFSQAGVRYVLLATLSVMCSSVEDVIELEVLLVGRGGDQRRGQEWTQESRSHTRLQELSGDGSLSVVDRVGPERIVEVESGAEDRDGFDEEVARVGEAPKDLLHVNCMKVLCLQVSQQLLFTRHLREEFPAGLVVLR